MSYPPHWSNKSYRCLPAIFLTIDEDIDLIVRHLSGEVANVAVISTHAIAFRVERPVTEAHHRVFIHTVSRLGAT